MTIAAIQESAEKGAVILTLMQAQRDIATAISAIRANDAAALGCLAHATGGLVAAYRAAQPIVMPVIEAIVDTMPDRVWNLDLDQR